VEGRSCLVVGGGPVAARKARGLLECGAVVTVIAPEVCAALAALTPLTIERRRYAPGDAAAHRLVVTATGIPEVDGAVYADADAAGVWVNSADDASHSSLILPSVHRDGSVTVAVSTGGSSPALASWLRRRISAQCGPALGELAELLGRAREGLRRAGRSTETVDWPTLLDGPLLELARDGRWDEVHALVEAATGVPIAPGPEDGPPG
jgi:precorrin-2 dehydrogenase / sirohydrochlorin ferrochelatase